ncbi:helix-turn-helix domain-containing protein [Paenibacillus sp. MMS20-IR301]|uniref:AraC family transcriptional regulator n=1 Tax=Paenibacillus sp. MMS20-IR301 TaxID=2895946 RepID=UPI0028E7DCCE|nr:helix-turn-helix domain-containing protein [Paenibacillus sp. MMS20-IR301]WNS40818.1 helix-turn-helix domain-containing protein [Paenibacillus sp. MMS20-IR301]
MQLQELDQYLRNINPIEKEQQQSGININDVWPLDWVGANKDYFRMPADFFFQDGPIHLRKHNRFAPMPLHLHNFVEMNYIYSGQCVQWINGKRIVLQQGQACLLDSDVLHSIEPMGENDILVNILMKPDIFRNALSRFSEIGILSHFMVNALSESTNHNRYILFESQEHDNFHIFIKNMMCEAFDPQVYSKEMIYQYMIISLTELMRVFTYHTNADRLHPETKFNLIQVLKYIELHHKDCTLVELAEVFNYNVNYLGNLLKIKTGKTFMELIKTQRMLTAASLLVNTGHSIEEIAHEVGYQSLGFFYRTFFDHYQTTPSKYRKQQMNNMLSNSNDK